MLGKHGDLGIMDIADYTYGTSFTFTPIQTINGFCTDLTNTPLGFSDMPFLAENPLRRRPVRLRAQKGTCKQTESVERDGTGESEPSEKKDKELNKKF